ncbi:L-threonine aldolase [Phyllobacterium sp. YR620]|uniref:threonine aldolase family protein n=1 Tax=Phyllobacterium sp. YR620 TaxID=1881066 RepID=UPI00087EB432|nr:GntG family PLP-dependent aldolase [Phyllobacterium sp. YR620]SDO88608.1 L-threonine aldolase [Phyllobacterium sp. YR620]
MFVDLRSDTLTQPNIAMLEAMRLASVGDDCYGEDPTVQELEHFCADYFGTEAAMFMPTGTMSNQVAIRALTSPGDELILEAASHINFFEAAQTSDFSHVNLNVIHAKYGLLIPAEIIDAVATKARWSDTYARPRLLILENSVNGRGGRVYTLQQVAKLTSTARQHGMLTMLDGARLLNACVATGASPREYCKQFDAVSVCFAKGLGAPFGSVLLGSRDLIAHAKRYRKWFGGALHQSGYMAAAALFAIKNNVERLAEDHASAQLLAARLEGLPHIRISAPETNIVLIDVAELGITASDFVTRAQSAAVGLIAWTPQLVRAVTSMNVSSADIVAATDRLAKIIQSLAREIPVADTPPILRNGESLGSDWAI